MLLLCVVWGLNQVGVKLAAPDLPLVMQACLRSAVAAILLLAWMRWRGIALFERDGTLLPGLLVGLLFAAEFGFIHAGLKYTPAARMVVFVYLAPVLAALGLGLWVPGERLRPLQWLGILVAFCGMASGFAEGLGLDSEATWRGDLMGVAGAVLWALTTILVRATALSDAPPAKTLLYQLVVATLTLPLASLALGEPAISEVGAVAMASLLYQGVVVAFVSYLTWFWLLTRYQAAQLGVFSFLTPLIGMGFGVLLLAERISPAFIASALLAGAGIVLVNLPARRRSS